MSISGVVSAPGVTSPPSMLADDSASVVVELPFGEVSASSKFGGEEAHPHCVAVTRTLMQAISFGALIAGRIPLDAPQNRRVFFGRTSKLLG